MSLTVLALTLAGIALTIGVILPAALLVAAYLAFTLTTEKDHN
ncbi:hypothetical protein ACIGDM_10415 [Rothia koreensis]